MDENRYWGTLQNWTPQNEEERQDQQRYIRASFEARELDRKEVLPDEAYQRMVSATVDEEQRIQFENDHISQSAYDEKMDEIVDIITEIDAKYGFGQERLREERDREVARKREELLAIKAYFDALKEENIGRNIDSGADNIMFHDDYENMEANELLVEYERIHASLEGRGDGSFENLVERGKEAIKEEHRRRIRERLNRKNIGRGNGGPSGGGGTPSGGNGGPSGGDNGPSGGDNGGNDDDDNKDAEKDKIERMIKQFNNGVNTIEAHLNRIKASLVLEDSNDLDVTEAIKGVDSELRTLDDEVSQLLTELDNFKSKYETADFSKDGKQILKELKELKDKLKNVKQSQVDKYNARVELTNKLISELKGLTGLDSEVAEMIAGLSPLDKCSDITKWDQIGYLRTINNYKDLIDVNKKIAEIQSRIGSKGKNPNPPGDVTDDFGDTDYFEADMVVIENEIKRIESEIKENMTDEEINALKQSIVDVADNINAFRAKLENNKDRISEDLYNHYADRINDAEANLTDLNTKLIGARGKGQDDNYSEYDQLMEKLNLLQTEVNNFDFLIEALHGKVLEGAVKVFEDQLNTLVSRLEEIEKEIEVKRAEGKLDDNQYNNLKNKVEEIKAILEKTREKLKNPEMIKDVDVFAFLNGRIDGVEKALDSLEQQVDSLAKPIKDKNVRKQIDAIIKKLEEEIKDIGQQLEKYKDEDPEKYEATKERLNAAKDRLEKISKKYRAKCPLMVRIVKEAKNFYKKHKKLVLIAAGLAAIALIHATVGPILIPAIMHGNIMIGYHAPVLRGFVQFANNILGGMIGATRNIHGIWSLANGVIINPSVAATSLLKGLAISGIGNTLLIAPVVVAIKKLVEKMKKNELKNKLTEDLDKMKKKQKDKKDKKKKEKNKENDDSTKRNKKAGKTTEEQIAELWREYQKSGKSIEEFCEEKDLSDQEKVVLEYYAARFQENLDRNAGTGRGGRR